MNPYIIKEEIKRNLNRCVVITVYGLRNRRCVYEGVIKGIYPNIFTIVNEGAEKSFSYADVITGDIKIKYK